MCVYYLPECKICIVRETLPTEFMYYSSTEYIYFIVKEVFPKS